MRLVALLAVLAVFQDSPGDEFWKLKTGAVLEYNRTRAKGNVETMKVTVEETKESKVWVTLEESVTNEKEKKKSKLAFFVENGQMVWAMVKDGATIPVYWFLKVGTKQGDKWKPGNDPNSDIEAEHMGEVELKIKAGTYKNATHVKTTNAQGGQNAYFVPGIGMVKMEQFDANGKVIRSTELTKFKDGK